MFHTSRTRVAKSRADTVCHSRAPEFTNVLSGFRVVNFMFCVVLCWPLLSFCLLCSIFNLFFFVLGLAPPLFIEVHGTNPGEKWAVLYMCVGVFDLHLSMIFLMNFETKVFLSRILQGLNNLNITSHRLQRRNQRYYVL